MIVRLLAILSLACAAPTMAQNGPAPLDLPAGKPFLHANSGITLPVTLLDLPRVGASEYATPQLDVLFSYKDTPLREELSVYIYRAPAGSPAVWFDQATEVIGMRPAFQRLTDIDLPATFTPPGQATASGMKAAWTVSDSQIRSTALAIVPVGEWLVKFRYSSTVHEAASLLRRLDEVIAAMGWPAAIPSAPAATLVSDCAAPLDLAGASKPVKEKGAGVAADAFALILEAKLKAVDKGDRPVEWCRDRAAKSALPIYRPLGSANSYLAALSDSGHGVWVRPSFAGLSAPGRKPRWSVSIVLAGEARNYPPRDRLPPPGQLDEILKDAPMSRVTTWGENQTISIDTSRVK
ncbi:hypothetical protein OK349_16950 [Sphingomonas sp. BT-65]|uniref:hypothetical protein n=1 Tax=Sphingomonas sp. BT-65 TaxID=2989821 RepID=UPI0022365CD8|nr:hypothetical protein [Sphingomonas sp. BT-65]MCW4463398.1 hypothetical protein [Sphingomonas sp. BT-65]